MGCFVFELCVYEVSLRLIHQAHFRSDTRYLMLYKLKHDSVMLQHQQQQSGPGTRDKNWDFNHFTIVWLIAFNSESEKLEWKIWREKSARSDWGWWAGLLCTLECERTSGWCWDWSGKKRAKLNFYWISITYTSIVEACYGSCINKKRLHKNPSRKRWKHIELLSVSERKICAERKKKQRVSVEWSLLLIIIIAIANSASVDEYTMPCRVCAPV